MFSFDENDKNSLKVVLKHLNILYIEDEINIRNNIEKTLSMFVNNVFAVENVKNATSILKKERIDLIISDINLPGECGINFIKEIRNNNYDTPVILLSAYTDKDYLFEATKLKLVDYLVKPIDFNILKEALIKASKEIINNGKFIIDFQNDISYNVMHKNLYYKKNYQEIDLTAKEMELLEYFIENNNRVISHEEIKNEIWEDSFEATDSALKNLLTKLRKKIGKESIKNISGVGFRVNIT